MNGSQWTDGWCEWSRNIQKLSLSCIMYIKYYYYIGNGFSLCVLISMLHYIPTHMQKLHLYRHQHMLCVHIFTYNAFKCIYTHCIYIRHIYSNIQRALYLTSEMQDLGKYGHYGVE